MQIVIRAVLVWFRMYDYRLKARTRRRTERQRGSFNTLLDYHNYMQQQNAKWQIQTISKNSIQLRSFICSWTTCRDEQTKIIELDQTWSQGHNVHGQGQGHHCLVSRRLKIKVTSSITGPVAWNSLPLHIRSAPTLSTFKNMLKTHLFSRSYFTD